MHYGRTGCSAGRRLAVTTAVLAAAPRAVWAAAESGTPYPGDLGQAVAALLIFAALLAILGRYAWKPVIAQLQRREEEIAQKLDEARKRQQQADELAAEYRGQLARIEQKMEEMLTAGRQELEKQRKDMLSAAQEEARRMLQNARDDISTATLAARRQLQAETARLAAQLAERFLAERLTPADQDRLIAQAVQQLAGGEGEGTV